MPPRDEQLSDHWQQWQLSHRRMFLFCNPDVTFSINLRRRGLLTAIYIYIYIRVGTHGYTNATWFIFRFIFRTFLRFFVCTARINDTQKKKKVLLNILE